MNVLLSSGYWPNLHYFFYAFNSPAICIEQHDHYQKQSYRNRCSILTANGALDLIIPVKKNGEKELMRNVEISYKERWQIKHWRAITSAYKNSPYFEFFEDELKVFYDREHQMLLDYNIEQLKTLLKILKLKKEIILTSSYEKQPAGLIDMREKIHPKTDMLNDNESGSLLRRSYYQTFESKFGFTPNLSILDLLLNKGLETTDYFPKETLTL